MNLKDQLDALLDATAFDSTGAKVGAVRQIYVDDASGKATFATIATGIFSADAIVPLHGARLLDDELHVDHTRAVIRDSPRPDNTEDVLTPEQEARLLEYYGIETPTRLRGTAASEPGTATGESAPSGGKEPSAGKTAGAGKAPSAGKAEGVGKTAVADKTDTPAGAGKADSARTTSGTPASGGRAAVGASAEGTGTSPGTGAARRPATPPASTGTTAPAGATSESGNKATTTSSAASSSSTDTPEPAKPSGPGPATPAGPPSDDGSSKGENPPRE
ncbi:PRC-barrel domain-containing protein [Dietzia maris]|uniref:PRC-barrel domain-containing protein n=1 Tax=Dietzia maris TaxID=37915 RepID=UPI0037CB973F